MGKAALYPAVLVLVAAVHLFDLSAMIAEKHTAMAETAAKPQPCPQELVDCRDNYGTLMLADDIIHARNVICAAWHPGMVTNGYDVNTYTGAWNVTIDWTAQTSAAVDSGTLDPDTLYVTGDADRFASWQAQYGDKADYITWPATEQARFLVRRGRAGFAALRPDQLPAGIYLGGRRTVG